MDGPWGHYAKWNEPATKRQVLYESTHKISKVVKLIETEGRMIVSKGWGEGKMGIEFQFCKMESSRDLLHNKVGILNTTEEYT